MIVDLPLAQRPVEQKRRHLYFVFIMDTQTQLFSSLPHKNIFFHSGGGSHCFKPSAPINVGMAAGAAVAVTLVVVGLVGGGYFYYTKFGFGAVTGSFANPSA